MKYNMYKKDFERKKRIKARNMLEIEKLHKSPDFELLKYKMRIDAAQKYGSPYKIEHDKCKQLVALVNAILVSRSKRMTKKDLEILKYEIFWDFPEDMFKNVVKSLKEDIKNMRSPASVLNGISGYLKYKKNKRDYPEYFKNRK